MSIGSLCLVLVSVETPETAVTTPVLEEEVRHYFHRDVDFGSDGGFNPLTVLVNNGFDILRQPSYQSSPFRVDWGTAFENLWSNLSRPDVAIDEAGGFGNFVNREIFPYQGFEISKTQFVPNYTLHLLGEGMVSRKLSEWYEARGVPAPYLLGPLTNFAVQLLNEAAENGSHRGANVDPIADIYFFNLLGTLLFSIDAVAEFFSGPLQILYWPHQAALDVTGGRLFNHGENYGFKIWLGDWTRWRAFAYMGNRALLGVSIPLGDSDAISVGAGMGLVELMPEYNENGARVVVPGTGKRNYELGVFWDRNGSLLASLGIGGMGNPRIQLNVYPGVVRFGAFDVGAFFLGGRYEGFGGGITFNVFPLAISALAHKDDSIVHF